jgi:hypothetical protein
VVAARPPLLSELIVNSTKKDWQVLNKKGSSNLAEQQAIIKPVLRLLKQYELVITLFCQSGKYKIRK